MTDSEIMEESDLDALLDEHGDHIYTYLRILCKGEDEASETLQNAYIKFIEQVRRGKVRRDSAPQYLITIAKNDFLGRLRKEKREVALLDDTADMAAQEQRANEELARDLRLILLETVHDPDLPEDLAMVIQLRFIDEVDLDTICRRTGRSQATVYRLMEKALSILADACRKAGLVLEDTGL